MQLAAFAALTAVVAAAPSSSTCRAAGWTVHAGFDATCGRSKAHQTTAVKSCSDCLRAAAKANNSVYAWNEHSHHCFTTNDCSPKFGGAPNAHVSSGCRTELPGCAGGPSPPSPHPDPPAAPPSPPGPPPGPATFVTIPAGSFTMGHTCLDCPAGAVMDDPKMAMSDGFLSYDEQPPHSLTLGSLSVMTQPVSSADYAKSGLPGKVEDISHEGACAFAKWYTAQQAGGELYTLPTDAEWERARKSGDSKLQFSAREHVMDWHGVYPNPTSPEASVTNGPSSGILKVVRDGRSLAAATLRYTLAPGATNAGSAHANPTAGTGIPPTTFRLVKRSTKTPLAYTNPPLSQVGILPDGTATTPSGVIMVAKLGPPAAKPLFSVRMVMPIVSTQATPPPPQHDFRGSFSLTDCLCF